MQRLQQSYHTDKLKDIQKGYSQCSSYTFWWECVRLNMTGNKWKREMLIYITGASTSTTASRWRGGKSTGNLLCLNGSHAETSHIVIKKNTVVLVFAFFFCHNIMSSCSHEKNCQNEWLWGTRGSTQNDVRLVFQLSNLASKTVNTTFVLSSVQLN